MPVLDEHGVLRFHSGVPYPERPFDEITPGLWLGGHYCQQGRRVCRPRDRFDLIVSLHQSSRYRDYLPTNGAPVINYRMADAPLDSSICEHLDLLAATVNDALGHDMRVLVRCRAGLNRSGLVLGLSLIRRGWTPAAAIDAMRTARSPHVLHITRRSAAIFTVSVYRTNYM